MLAAFCLRPARANGFRATPAAQGVVRFDLYFWGAGGGLQYFAPILASKQHKIVHDKKLYIPEYQKVSLNLKIQVRMLSQLQKLKSSKNLLEWGRGPTPKTTVAL